jgi:hypothetical protein
VEWHHACAASSSRRALHRPRRPAARPCTEASPYAPSSSPALLSGRWRANFARSSSAPGCAWTVTSRLAPSWREGPVHARVAACLASSLHDTSPLMGPWELVADRFEIQRLAAAGVRRASVWSSIGLAIAVLAASCTSPGAGSSASACPSTAPTTGSACAPPGTACPYDGCTACLCESNGTWACPGGPGDCASCPATINVGDSCNGSEVCLQWAFCGLECSCGQGKWSCSACAGGDCSCPALVAPSCRNGVCEPPVTTSCPGALPHEGDACSASPTPCLYPWPAGCAQATCSCSNGHWSCSYGDTDCVDGG